MIYSTHRSTEIFLFLSADISTPAISLYITPSAPLLIRKTQELHITRKNHRFVLGVVLHRMATGMPYRTLEVEVYRD